MTEQQPDNPEAYRPNVGLALFSKEGHVFLGRRIHGRGPWQWQLPQGGIDEGETPEAAAARELEEEVGISAKLTHIMQVTEDWIYYDFPPDVKKRFGGPYIGQKQKWYLLQLIADEQCIDVSATEKPEFDGWCWSSYWFPLGQVVSFKRDVYRRALKELAPKIVRVQRLEDLKE